MPFVSFANTALVELVYEYHQVICENTLYFRKDAQFSVGDLSNLVDWVYNWWVSELSPLTSNEVVLGTLKGRDMSTQFGNYFETTIPSGNEGQNENTAEPGNVTCAVQFQSGLVGRRNRGRNFFVGMTTNQRSGNFLTPTFQAALAGAYQDLPTYLVDPECKHVIASRATAVSPSWIGTTIPVVSYSVDSRVDTQRRRLV